MPPKRHKPRPRKRLVSRTPLPALSGRKLHKDRYSGVGVNQTVVEAYRSMVKFLRDARLSKDAQRKALQLAMDEVEDGMARETVSWVEDVGTRWPPAGKGRDEQEDFD